MTQSTIEQAYQLARSGHAADFAGLKALLKANGCRAVDALLAPRSIREHLQAICVASSGAARRTSATQTANAQQKQTEPS